MRSGMTIAAALALIAAGCGGGGETTAEQTSPTTATTPAPASGVSLVETPLGQVLADPDGYTLYAFTVDEPGVSRCYDGCAALWPPVDGSTPVSEGLDESMFSTIDRDDGSTQLVIGDWPLYRFTGDAEPGDVNGQGLEGVWFVVDAGGGLVGAGEALDESSGDEAPTDAPASPRDDYGYDY
jgi:predicted lipoprotein with Yx(FWY)xxD motif